jgi:hypothetical protein
MKYFSEFLYEANKSGDSSLRDWFAKSKSSDGTPGWVQLGGKYAGKPCAKNWGNKTKKEEVQYLNIENYSRIQSRGTTYSILLNWRGQMQSVQIFFPKFTRPTKEEVTFEIRKLYPGARVLSFNPSLKDPTKPLLYTGDTQ